MSAEYTQFEKRKQDHIELALMMENQADESHRYDAITLMHDALPDINFDEIRLTGTRFGQTVEKPLMVASMTAGHHHAENINRNLMAACMKTGWAMGVGSQRRELTDLNAATEWRALRRDYSGVSLYSNLGIAQVITTPIESILRLTDAIQADALIVHCNPLQECIQPEGTPVFKGCWDSLALLVKHLPIPLVVKETGCGFSKATLSRLNAIGVNAVDVSGLGGTHWGRIEGHRAPHESIQKNASKTFRNWGIDTVSSVMDAYSLSPVFEIWGSGGVRHGLDAAKLFALGASTVAFAKPMLAAAIESAAQVTHVMNTIEYEIKVALFCTGSRTLYELKEKIRC